MTLPTFSSLEAQLPTALDDVLRLLARSLLDQLERAIAKARGGK